MKTCFLFLTLFLIPGFCWSQDELTLDPSFGGKGFEPVHFKNSRNIYDDDGIQTLRKPDGSYLVLVKSGPAAQLIAYNSSGTRDESFGVKGLSDNMNMSPTAMTFQGTKILVGGETSDNHWAVYRFKNSGLIDSSFGTNGIETVRFENVDHLTGINIQDDQKIVVSGWTNGSFTYSSVLRFKENGGLDDTFGKGGTVSCVVNENLEYEGQAIQADGKIILAGYSWITSPSWRTFITLVRYKPDGTLDVGDGTEADPGFGKGGIVTTTIEPINWHWFMPQIECVTIQPSDGKILVTGNTVDSYGGININDLLIARYDTKGNLDTAFGNAGIVRLRYDLVDVTGKSIAMQGNKIVVAARAYSNTTKESAVLITRFNPDGSFDTDFSSDGQEILKLADSAVYINQALVDPEPDGKILITGLISTGGVANYDFLLARYTNTGSLDPAFNASGFHPGIVTSYVELPEQSALLAIANQPDKKIVVAGITYDFQLDKTEVAVARYNPNGRLDMSFGTGGIVTSPAEEDVKNIKLALQADGKIILAVTNYHSVEDNTDVSLLRFTSAGILDTTYGKGGIVTNTYQGEAESIAVQYDGKLLVTGGATCRFTTSGELDLGFGTDGILTTGLPNSNSMVHDVNLQPDKKMLVGGSSFSYDEGSTENFMLARYTSKGVLDNKFGSGGIAVTDFGYQEYITATAIQPDGKIIAIGTNESYDPGMPSLYMARYNSNGGLDTSFGQQGKVAMMYDKSIDPRMLRVLADGKILVAGIQDLYGSMDYLVLRFTSKGELDNSFGIEGKQLCKLPFASSLFFSSSMADGKLYVAGQAYDPIALPIGAGVVAVYNLSTTTAVNPVITINNVTVNETDAAAILTVTMSNTSTSPVAVNYATQDYTAISKGKEADYRPAKGSVIIQPGTTTATISVGIRANAQKESTETFFVNLSLPTGSPATIGVATGVVTILDGAVANSVDEFTRMNKNAGADLAAKLGVKAIPNPSTGLFTLQVTNANNTPVDIRVHDISGRLIENRTGVAANSSIKIGGNYLVGVYYAEVIQGTEKVVVKLVKQ